MGRRNRPITIEALFSFVKARGHESFAVPVLIPHPPADAEQRRTADHPAKPYGDSTRRGYRYCDTPRSCSPGALQFGDDIPGSAYRHVDRALQGSRLAANCVKRCVDWDGVGSQSWLGNNCPLQAQGMIMRHDGDGQWLINIRGGLCQLDIDDVWTCGYRLRAGWAAREDAARAEQEEHYW